MTLQLDGYFWLSPLALWITLSDTMKAGPRGGGFQVSFSLIFPSSVSEVCSVSLGKVLPSRSEKLPKATAINYIVLGFSYISLTNNAKGSFPRLVQELLGTMWLLALHIT